MSVTSAELSSMAATVHEVMLRLGPIANTYGDQGRDDLVSEVQEAERALGAAVRRLERLAGST